MKKNGFHSTAMLCTGPAKRLLLMCKWTFIFVFVACLKLSANVYSQNAKVTMNLKDADLKKALIAVEKKAKLRLLYSEDILPEKRNINLIVKDEPVLKVLDFLLANTGFKYRILQDELIVLVPGDALIVDVRIRGRVTDEKGAPLEGVSVTIAGASKGVTTNADGNFDITVPEKSKLSFSFVGFVSQTVEIGDRSEINISMKADEVGQKMNEVIVVGYGTQKRTDVTGAVASVPKSRLTQLPVTNILHAIEGSTAGVNITQTSSVPGSSASVLVRGQNTITAGTGPFIVVDGVPFSKTGGVTNDINPNDIASIEILKDASATAIYGVNGANGVILITTKRGTSGKPQIRYNGYVGFDNIAHMLDPLSPEGYVQKYKDWYKQVNSGNNPPTVLPNNFEVANYNANKTVDWIKEVTQQGIIQDHNISISGGTKDMKYYVSGEYLKQQGPVKGYQYNRGNIRANLDINVTDYLTAGTSIFFTNNNYDGGRVNFYLAAAMSPYGTLRNSNGAYEIYPMSPELLYENPLIRLNTERLDRTSNLNTNVFAELKPGFIKGLKYRLNVGYSIFNTRQGNYAGRAANNQVGTANVAGSETKNWVIENILTYAKDFGQHHIDLTGLYSAQERNYFATNIVGTGFINDELSYNNIGAASTVSAGTVSGSITGSYRDKYNLLSQMGRLNYSFDSRYLFTFTVRRDGSSVMGANTDKFGVFPSVALGWNITNEKFMQSISAINNLKMRLSYGKAGNEAINPLQTVTTAGTVRIPFSGASTIGVLASNLGNANLHWETSSTFNAGLDFTVLNNRLNGSIDFYQIKTEDLLLRRNIPIITGYSNVLDNLGKTQNNGIELTLTSQNVKGKDFAWETTVNFTHNKNKIIELYGDGKDDIGNRWFIGKPISVIYDYKMVGVWQVGEDASQQDPGAKPGDLKFADVTGDKKITADDRIVLGQTAPKWIGGLTNTFHYKNLHLNIFIQTFQGATKNNVTLTYADEAGRMNIPVETGYWTADNKSQTRPALSYTNTRGYGYASENNYTRIKDVTLSYNFSQKLLDKIKIASLTAYLSGRNLYTFTDWVGWDPEHNYSFRGSGDWTNNYPLTRSFVLGLNVTLR